MKEDLKALRIEKDKKAGFQAGNAGRVWMVLCLVLVVALLGVSYLAFWNPPPDPVPSVAVADAGSTPAPVEKTGPPPGREVLIASGYVVAHHKHELGSKVMGRVEWIGVEKGDFVRKGQLLVKLEDREYRAQLEQARASLKLAEERLAELEAGSRPEEIRRAEAELKRAEAERHDAKLELERLRGLLKVGVVSQQQVDTAQARFDIADAAVRSALHSLELLRLGPREEQIRQARAEVERARAAVQYAETMLDATEIRAPITGTVLRRIAEVGEMITTSFAGEGGAKSAVVALADLQDLQVELDIAQTDFNRISPDHECRMTPEAYPDREYKCVIDEISPEANRQKASIQVKVKILEPDSYLRPEMSARVTFLRKEGESQ
ncbi:MAG: efflux RND transporter periplasmic adaptor subunit [Acidobacteriota bacterium]